MNTKVTHTSIAIAVVWQCISQDHHLSPILNLPARTLHRTGKQPGICKNNQARRYMIWCVYGPTTRHTVAVVHSEDDSGHTLRSDIHPDKILDPIQSRSKIKICLARRAV